MSNFLLVVGHSERFGSLRNILDEISNGSQGDRSDGWLASGWRYSWFSHRAHADAIGGGGLFTGFAVDDKNQIFAFGSEGWRQQNQLGGGADLPGCYVRVGWNEGHLTVHGDVFRMMPLFVSTEPGVLLASDSAYVLMQLRRRLNLPVTLDRTVTEAVLWPNAMAAQLLGSRTLVREISYVTVGGHIRLDLRIPNSRASVSYTDVHTQFSPEGDAYRHELRTAAVRIASAVHTVATSGPEHARLALSGGKDSRICLAAVLLSSQVKHGAVFSCTNTQPQHQRDYEVVQALAKEFGFDLGSRLPPDHRTRQIRRFPQPFTLWLTDQSLCYYPFKVQSYALAAPGPFSIAGLGSELYKGNYELQTLPQVISSLAARMPRVARAVDEIATDALLAAGVQPGEPQSVEWHYLLLRNALHGGRFVPATKLGLRPLQQSNLVGLAKLAGTARFPELEHPSQISDDLLALLNPSLAARPFDKPGKNVAPSDIIDRLRHLGGPISSTEITQYRMLGSVSAVRGGPLPSLARLVPESGPAGRLARSELIPMVDAAVAQISESALPAEISAAAHNAARTIRDAAVAVSHSRGDVGRILAIAEVIR